MQALCFTAYLEEQTLCSRVFHGQSWRLQVLSYSQSMYPGCHETLQALDV